MTCAKLYEYSSYFSGTVYPFKYKSIRCELNRVFWVEGFHLFYGISLSLKPHWFSSVGRVYSLKAISSSLRELIIEF